MATKTTKKFWEGIGRRKSSSARVRIYEGKSPSLVNGKPFIDLYPAKIDQDSVLKPLIVTGRKSKIYFTVIVKGGGKTGRRDAITLGLARALVKWDKSLAKELRKESLLTRDSRGKERKKYGLLKARKRPQFSKR